MRVQYVDYFREVHITCRDTHIYIYIYIYIPENFHRYILVLIPINLFN